jgi:hypothetical protein
MIRYQPGNHWLLLLQLLLLPLKLSQARPQDMPNAPQRSTLQHHCMHWHLNALTMKGQPVISQPASSQLPPC